MNPSRLIAVAEAAEIADVSHQTIHRWIKEGWLEPSFRGPHANSPILIDESYFLRRLPAIQQEMASRVGQGRGRRFPDANGNPREPYARPSRRQRPPAA